MNDDGFAAAGDVFLGLQLGAHHEAAAAGAVGVWARLPVLTVEEAAGGEVGALDVLHARARGRSGLRPFRLLSRAMAGVEDFGEVVRRDVGGHADGDAAAAVDDAGWGCARAGPRARRPDSS